MDSLVTERRGARNAKQKRLSVIGKDPEDGGSEVGKAVAKIERKATGERAEGDGVWHGYTCTSAVAPILDRVGAVVSSLGYLWSDLPLSSSLSLFRHQFCSPPAARLT